MTRQLLYAHWKAARWALLPFVLLAFGLPLMLFRSAHSVVINDEFESAYAAIEISRVYLPVFPVLAFLTGAVVALAGWNWDHRANHVYALSLPIRRSSYVLHKMAVGAALVLIPALALWIASFLGGVLNPLPAGINSYPLSFGFRFLLAALFGYGLVFVMASSTVRTTVMIVSTVLVVIIFGTILVSYLRDALGMPTLLTPVDLLVRALTTWPGPFNVYGGRWMLIDV